MENNVTNPISDRPGCSILLKSCLIITAVVFVLFTAGLIYMLRMSSVRSLTACAQNMREISSAIQRYQDVSGRRPESLSDLREEYLERPAVLRCPLDQSTGNAPSYAYSPGAGSGQVMLECARHRVRKDMPVSRLVVRGNGLFEVVRPSLQDTLEEARKHAERRK